MWRMAAEGGPRVARMSARQHRPLAGPAGCLCPQGVLSVVSTCLDRGTHPTRSAMPVTADQSGRTSAPINPHRMQTMGQHSDSHWRFIRQPIRIHDCAVVAPIRFAVDQKLAAAVPPNVAKSGCEQSQQGSPYSITSVARSSRNVGTSAHSRGWEDDRNLPRQTDKRQ